MYAEGEGVPQDYVWAHVWLEFAANGGYATAQRTLDAVAKMMTPADISKAEALALEWWEKSLRPK